MESVDSQSKILRVLKDAPRGLYLKEISEKAELSSGTVRTHSGILEAKELIVGEKIGNAKVFTLTSKGRKLC